MTRAFAALQLVLPLVLAASLAVPAPAAAQRVGLFFDRQASVCSGTIEPFHPQCDTVFVFVYPPPGVVLGGVRFRLQLPPEIRVCSPPGMLFPHNLYFDVRGSLEMGYDARFADCVTTGDPLLVALFTIADVSFSSAPRPNLVLHLTGSAIDSLQANNEPQLVICEPGNPEGGLGFVPAPSVDAYLNCTWPCGCTTAVVPRTWSAVKRLYREP